MTPPGFGDLARTVPLTRRGVEARADLARLSQELATGRRADVAEGQRGDLRRLAGIERSLALLDRHEAAAQSAQGRMGVMQTALEGMQTAAQRAAGDFFALAEPGASAGLAQAGDAARAALGAALSALGTRMGGVHVFSGAASDTPPLPPMDDMLAALRAEVGGETDPAALRTAVQGWFAPGGGLDQAWPLPGADEPAVLSLAQGETLTIGATAADPSVRGMLASLALGALAGEGGALDTAGRQEAVTMAATALLGDEAGLVTLRGRLGVAENQSERALTRVRAEAAGLELARGEIVEVDRYEVATKLQAAEAGVETLYLVTARLSNLSFANYMR